jgi:hypothetical protein
VRKCSRFGKVDGFVWFAVNLPAANKAALTDALLCSLGQPFSLVEQLTLLLLARHIPHLVEQASAIVHVELLSRSGTDELLSEEGSHPTKIGPATTSPPNVAASREPGTAGGNQAGDSNRHSRNTFYMNCVEQLSFKANF